MAWHSDILSPLHAAVLLWIAGAFALLLCVMIARALYKAKEPSFAKLVGWLRANYVPLFICVGGGLVVLAFVFYLWEIGLLVSRVVDILRLDTADRAIVPQDFRNYATGIALLLGALAAGATLLFQLVRVWINERTAKNAEQGLITDRINKAVEGLGAEKTVKRPVRSSDGTLTYEEATEPNLEVRVGAVLALERIAKDSPDDHIQIMEILCAYIRENACIVNIGSDEEPNWQQRVDTQTALTVIGCRKESAANREREAAGGYQLDIRHANLQCADMSLGRFDKAQFEGALLGRTNLGGATLQEADLGSANLQEAYLDGTNLQEAKLGDANLQGADLWRANLQGADLEGTKLQEAKLRRANLQGADLGDANLQEAKLGRANLQEANLRRANLQGAELWRANLKEAYLMSANLQEAYLEGANLQGAYLEGANLQGADLRDVELKSTDLRRCHIGHTRLRSVDFTQDTTFDRKSLNQAFGVKSGYGAVKLPDDDPPDHWHTAEETDEWSPGHDGKFDDAFKKWTAANPLPKS